MAKQITVPYNFTPRSYQLELFRAMDGIRGKPETRKRRAILRWHRRAGKDKCCWCFLLKEAAQTPGNYFYVFPTKTMARQALWENVDKDGFKLLNHMPKELIARLSNQEMLMQLTNGSTIRVVGYDKDPDSVRGIACKGAVFSEFAFSDPDSYKIMVPALRESEGWAIFNSTPNGRNHYHALWQSVVNSPRWFVSYLQTYWPKEDGYSGLIAFDLFPHIMQEEGLTEEDVEREYGSSFSTGMSGSYYMKYIDKAYASHRIGDFMYDPSLKVDTFWDVGFRDSTVIWFRQKIHNKIIFIDYYQANGEDPLHYVQLLENKGYDYGIHCLPHDAANRTSGGPISTCDQIEELLRRSHISALVHVLDRPKSKQAGINAVRLRFPRYHFDAERCKEGLKHLELYHRRWNRQSKSFADDPVHDKHSDTADALRYEAIYDDPLHDNFYRQNKIKVLHDYDLFGDE